MSIFQQTQKNFGVQKDFENARRAVKARARDEWLLCSQTISNFPGVKNESRLSEIVGQNAIFREVQRLNRQAQTFGFPDFESLQNAIAAARMRMEAEERRQQKLA